MPAQDRVRGDQAMATQCAGQPPHEGGEHGPVRPVQARSWVGAAQDGDLVAQHEELDVLGGGRAAHQQDQPEHLPEDQVQQPQRHVGIMSDQRSPLVSDPGPTSGTPHGLAGRSDTLFSDDATALIHQTSRGYPRAVNNLALQALVAAFAADKNIVDESSARTAVTEVTTE